ncbi:MAG: glutamate--tRNA ligase [Rickettsiales bacterium]
MENYNTNSNNFINKIDNNTNIKQIITRFAPSPTGHLHIGGARTALFNYLFAKHYNGKFLLRIEDTDLERSRSEYYNSIMQSLKWLNINHDDEIVFQSKNINRHLEVANEMLKNGSAYKCFLTQEEIEAQRQAAEDQKIKFILNSKWKFASNDEHPHNMPFSIRLKTPLNQQIIIDDVVQGKVIIDSSEIDDQVLVRSNGLPTYMLSVVVDDHDMGVTHIIRGDDHLVNTPKQILIYNALNWQVPIMHHISLIHGSDGAKLSKRHGATSMIEYQDKYLPGAIRNYFLNLGWHSDLTHEIMSYEEQIKIFNSNGFRRAPARIDFDKLNNINHKHINMLKPQDIIDYLRPLNIINLSSININNISLACASITDRCKILPDIITFAKLYTTEFIPNITEQLNNSQLEIIKNFLIACVDNLYLNNDSNHIENDKTILIDLTQYDSIIKRKEYIEEYCKNYAASLQLKIGALMLPIRLALTGEKNSPSIFEMLAILDKYTVIKRLENAIINS